jgi:hypothetical protein
MYIDVVDMTDSLGANRIQWLDYLKAVSKRILLYGMSNGVSQMVSEIGRLAGSASIDALRIWGHAYPGGQLASGGTDGSSIDLHFTGISAANFGAVSALLSRLTPLLKTGGRAELRGCSVASGGAGETLLISLAGLWKVPVFGGSVVQTTGRWDPPVVRADPTGGLQSAPGPAV